MRTEIFDMSEDVVDAELSQSNTDSPDIEKETEEEFSMFSEIPVKGTHTSLGVNMVHDKNVIHFEPVDIDAVVISRIDDTKGRLSDIVDMYLVRTGEICIPLNITTILPQVHSLQRYDILEYKNRRFATSQIIREDVINTWVSDITCMLSEGLSFEEPLEQATNVFGSKMNNLILTVKEQAYLVSAFRNYHAYVYFSEEEDSLMLKIDGISDANMEV